MSLTLSWDVARDFSTIIEWADHSVPFRVRRVKLDRKESRETVEQAGKRNDMLIKAPSEIDRVGSQILERNWKFKAREDQRSRTF